MIIVIVGLPGSGKSAYGVKLLKKWQKKGIPSYSNYEVDGSFYFETEDLGRYLLEDGNMVLDEAGIDISNRDFVDRKNKTTDKIARKFWKTHRHYGIGTIVVLSQAFDFDKCVRNLASEMWIIKKTVFPHVSLLTRVKPFWDVDQDGQPVIKWKISPLSFKVFYRRPYYKFYDSYTVTDLPFKDWPQINVPGTSKLALRHKRLDDYGDILGFFDNTLGCLPFPNQQT